jgi:hypothetical protein
MEINTQPCVGSGMCCKKSACAFGEWDPVLKQCAHLKVGQTLAGGVEVFRCGIYEEIRQQPGSEWNPAFGAGCCMSLFNDNRQRIIIALRAEALKS